MNHSFLGTLDELTLEPMEIDTRDGLFGDFSSRDRKPRGKAARSGKACRVIKKDAELASADSATKKPVGKSTFLVDDRRSPDRRSEDRRTNVRLTGDRRKREGRRAKTDPWDREFRK